MLHSNIVEGDMHFIQQWSVADITARDALVVVANDVGKVAEVGAAGATKTFYVLADDSPMTWTEIGGSGGGGTVTSVTSANADATVATQTTTPVITIVQAPALRSATTTVNVSSATAPTNGQVLTATSGTAATWQTPSTVDQTQSFVVACSDETTALTVGTAKVTFRMPYAFTVTAVRASLTTAQTAGTIFTVDINEGGVSMLSTKLTIDNGEKTSTTAVAPPVISDSSLADDSEISIDIDQVGDGTAKGLKVALIGTKI